MDPVGGNETREILLKHLEMTPKEILGSFPRFDKKETNGLVYHTEALGKNQEENHFAMQVLNNHESTPGDLPQALFDNPILASQMEQSILSSKNTKEHLTVLNNHETTPDYRPQALFDIPILASQEEK